MSMVLESRQPFALAPPKRGDAQVSAWLSTESSAKLKQETSASHSSKMRADHVITE